MTKEEAMKLAPGSIILVEAIAKRVEGDGVVAVSLHGDSRWHNYAFDHVYAKPEMPKHDPRRLFRKGDKVQPRSGKNVLASEYGFVTLHDLVGQYEVKEDEARGTVSLIVNGHACFVSAFALELVTPVEELRPFTVVHKPALQHFQINHGKLNYMTFPYGLHKSNGWYHTITTAKAAAEAECDRLNAEWRKEVGTEVPCSEDGKEGE